jgi:hypothetical protein
MKLANITANRHIVQIFNEDQTKLEATILAFNNYRLEPTEKTVLQYWETPAGSPPALRAWFFPGDNYGQEFAYPKEMAETLAARNHARVASYDSTAALTQDTAGKLQVRDTPEQTEAGSAVTSAAAPAARPQQVAQAERPREDTVFPAPVAPAPAPADNSLLAQNNAPATLPTQSIDVSELPQTASPMPWMLTFGLISLLSAAVLRATLRA